MGLATKGGIVTECDEIAATMVKGYCAWMDSAGSDNSMDTARNYVRGQLEGESETVISNVAQSLHKRLFSRERLIQQHKEGKLQPHETIDWGPPQGSEFGGPDDPGRFDKW
jgi:hypothetical protein